MAESLSYQNGDLWANPYSYIDDLFGDALLRNNNQVSPALSDMNEVQLLEKSMLNASFSSAIPYLSRSALGKLQPGKLCRYQGIVQDMYGSELYSEAVGASNVVDGGRNIRVSKYRDVLPNDCSFESQLDSDGDVDNPNEYYRDRMSFLLVPVPGLTAWVKERESGQRASPNVNQSACPTRSDSRKRNASILGSDGLCDFDAVSNNAKLQTMDVDGEIGNKKVTEVGKYEGKDCNAVDRAVQPVGEIVDTSEMFSIFGKSFPGIYDEEEGICCLAKMYDYIEGTFRLNDMIEIVGIFTSDPILCAVEDRDGYMDGDCNALADLMDPFRGFEDNEDTLSLPPPSVAPRIHCISFRRLGSSFPLLYPVHLKNTTSKVSCKNYSNSLWGSQAAVSTERAFDNAASRQLVLEHITRALGGDDLAGEYVLLAVLSRLYNREEESLLLGSLSVNLCGMARGDDRVAALKIAISDFVPLCVQICADVDSLNSIEMMPVRDYSKNRLSLSPLQLGSGTVLLVDETSVGEGTLTPTGTRSMCALRSIASHQQLPMSYPYYELKVPTDLPLLLLTCSSSGNSLSGASGALKVVLQPPQPVQSTSCPMEESKDSGIGAMQVADMPSTEGSLEPHDRDSEKGLEWLGKARNWWSTVRLIEVSMSESVATEGVDSFAHARQSDCRLTQADFHRWLTVSRLLALSEGASEISSQHWSKMRDLERRRLDRISPCSA